MKTFILLVYLSAYAAQGGMTSFTAEFDTAAACQIAAEKIQKEWQTLYHSKAKAMCLPKG